MYLKNKFDHKLMETPTERTFDPFRNLNSKGSKGNKEHEMLGYG